MSHNGTSRMRLGLALGALCGLVSGLESGLEGEGRQTNKYQKPRDIVTSFINVDREYVGSVFSGIGAISGGGATSRLLVDYPEKQRSEILDYLFLPSYGASLQMFKVEIGGDSPTTDGTEPSYMHNNHTYDFSSGYEWWMMKEAKKRNPDIKLYGLPWAFPGWLSTDENNPYTDPEVLATYVVGWVSGALKFHNLSIDYIGIWNERPSNGSYVKCLRRQLDEANFTNTQIVAADGDLKICEDLLNDQEYSDAVSIIGLHYPYADHQGWDKCVLLGKPVWASEESSSYDDANGAGCWSRVVNAHFVLHKISASIMWNAVGAYYHGNNWFGTAMINAVEPWTGHYQVTPVTWATAHLTQLSSIGWRYLENNHGSGQLSMGGYYVTLVDPESHHLTINIAKISHDHARCVRPNLPSEDIDVVQETEIVEISLSKTTLNLFSPQDSFVTLHVWKSNFEPSNSLGNDQQWFERLDDIYVYPGETGVRIHVSPGDVLSISTLDTARKGQAPPPPASQPRFPLPYASRFDQVEESQAAPGFCDQFGSFELHEAEEDLTQHKSSKSPHKRKTSLKVMRQMVQQCPIHWARYTGKAPVSVIGNIEWQDLTIEAVFRINPELLDQQLPSSPNKGMQNSPHSPAAGCVATRTDQYWSQGPTFCFLSNGTWTLTEGGWYSDGKPSRIFAQGTLPKPGLGAWLDIRLETLKGLATAWIGSQKVLDQYSIPDGVFGFAAVGSNGWWPVEFRNVSIDRAGVDWHNHEIPCQKPPTNGSLVTVRPCPRNGDYGEGSQWLLLPDWTILHNASGLCLTAQGLTQGAGVVLSPCLKSWESGSVLQKFRNDYSTIRNKQGVFALNGTSQEDMGRWTLRGNLDGSVSIQSMGDDGVRKASSYYNIRQHAAFTSWNVWTYFPNSKQIRNQYTQEIDLLGYPMCLSAC
ncbi:hypothetical protein AAMO2058_001013600 [Amorphochlora amoebiformis]